MELNYPAFAFIISLAAVVNGLGIVRWIAGFAEYLRQRNSLQVKHYWVFNLWAAAQFLLHILLRYATGRGGEAYDLGSCLVQAPDTH
jgi:hypothetical protein